jgi:tetratricopeptide (TPR) repeat protein
MLTTRIPQVALAFADGGVASVSELSEDDGLALLARMAPGAVEAEPDEVQALVRAVGGLPLALTLMGWHLRKESYGRHPRRLREALERLCEADARQQITQPQTVLERRPDLPAETPLSLQTVIDISVEALDGTEQGALRALSVLPPKPNTFSEEAALAVAGMPVEILDALVDHGLLEPSGAWRYTMHQTIADYARLGLADDAGAQRAARERMVSYYVDYVKTHKQAYDTLEVESDNITAALELASEGEMEAELVQGANSFYPFLESRGLCDLAQMHLDRARQMARDKGDVAGLVSTLRNLGQAMQWLGNYEQADAFYQKGLNPARESGDRKSATAILQGLGIVAACRGDYARAEACCQEGLSLARESGDWEAEGALLSSLGDLCLALGKAEQATEYFQRGLVISREAGNREKESMNLIYLGLCSHSLGKVEQAIERYQQALSIAREIGDRRAEGYALGYLGYAHVTWGQIETDADDHYLEAIAYYQQALAITREIGHRKGEAECLTTLGVAYCALGQTEQAIEVTEAALAIARELGVRSEESRGLCGLGDVYRGLGQIDRAIECYQQALAIARQIGVRRQEADALSGLAKSHADLEQVQPAIECTEQALAILEEIKSPKAAQMRELLAQLRAQVTSSTP